MTSPKTRPARSRSFMAIPVRLRITVAVVILTGLALSGAGIAVYALQADRLDDNVTSAITQEIAEFEQLKQGGDETGTRYTSTAALLRDTLRRNVPNEDELILGFWDGQIKESLPGAHTELANDPDFEELIAEMATDGDIREVNTRFGDVRVAVKPVEGPDGPGAAVFAYFMEDIRADLRSQMETYAVVAGVALLAVAGGAYLVAGRLLKPVRYLRDTARDITHSDLSRRITATGNDDLTDLTLTFNAMLDRLEGAFSTQRQFLDDAGHELKTPITIVRGHLELMREADASEVAATRDLVLEEMDRMARLVEELTLLAKSRRPDFLRRTDTDIAVLTETLVNKMRGLAPRQWLVDEQADGTVRVDSQRITQAALQLASNAAAHTRGNDVIALGTRLDERGLALWVRDTGTGVAADVDTDIFDRFTQGTQTRQGSGLGLAIVQAIVEAHSGHVGVESVPGKGATFTMTIPTNGAARSW